MKPLYLPSLTGQFGNWRYFEIVMTIEEIVRNLEHNTDAKPNYRVKLVSEVEEIYSRKGLGQKLQRVFEDNRLEPIKNYLSKQGDKYINNITVAVFGEDPEWYPIDVSTSSVLDIDEQPGEDFWEDLTKSFGIIRLSGRETIFVLDGQHRVMGLREAINIDRSIGQEQVAITMISHEDTREGRETTRRLFTTINRHAKPVSLGENILLDEDDLSAIIARRSVEEYPLFIDKDVIALNKTADIKLPKDESKFTTVIQLWNINEMLINPKDVYPKYVGGKGNLVRIRPSDKIIQEYTDRVYEFWDTFFESFPIAAAFVEQPNTNIRKVGGPLSLRPIGQTLFCDYYKRMIELGRKDEIKNIISAVPDELDTEFWHHILLDPADKTIIGSPAYARTYLYYQIGLPITAGQHKSLIDKYRKYVNNPNAQIKKLI